MELVHDDGSTQRGGTAASLGDTATITAAGRDRDALLAVLAAQPFSQAAYCGLRACLKGSAQRGRAASKRGCAATAVPVL